MASPAAQALGPLISFLPYNSFNKVQEAVIPSLFANDRNCLIAAPTGSGKTVLLEVAMLRLFRSRLTHTPVPANAARAEGTIPSEPESTLDNRKCKAVYICPIKALANEKYDHWRQQFPTLSVVIETGDQMQQRSTQHSSKQTPVSGDASSLTVAAVAEDMSSVSHADILITTPERWDSITRRWKEKEVMAIVNSVGLLLLDEVHTVQEERGAAMEAIVSRVKVIQAATAHDAANSAATRIVAISGTLPNIRDMAEWLQVEPAMTFAFSPADRPVPLAIKVISYAHDSANPFAFHRFLAFKIFSLIQQYSEGKPTLVFCSSRKEVTSSALRLVDDIHDAATRRGQLAQLQPSDEVKALAQQAADKQLRSCLLSGVGFHHAAMTLGDRLLVERMFREQFIAVVCSTTTLALGVNLPAHLVVIKGTTFFANGQCQDMPVSEVMQMCGRAGRPGLDAHGVALVLTTQRKWYMYETLRNGSVALTCVESHLHQHMIEHVNAEVALHTIQSFASAVEWGRTTFFWIRLRKSPRHYGLSFASKAEQDDFSADAFMEALMERVLRVLVEEGCVRISFSGNAMVSGDPNTEQMPSTVGGERERLGEGDGCEGATDLAQVDFRHPGVVFEPTRLGRAMSRMYILFDTVCILNAEFKRRGVAQKALDDGDAAAVAAPEAGQSSETAGGGEGQEQSRVLTDDDDGVNGTQRDTAAADADDLSTAHNADTQSTVTSFTLHETLQLLCHCQELVEVRLRQGDRGPLNEINRAVRYPLCSGRRGNREVREDWHKAYLLIQAHVGLLPLTEVSLRNDAQRLWSVVPRVSRFLEEYAWAHTHSYSLACCANLLARVMERRVWPDGPVLRQLPSVNDAVAKALLRGGFRGFSSLSHVDARQLEVLCSRLPPFGSQVLSQLRSLPHLELELDTASAVHTSGCVGTVRLFCVRQAEAAQKGEREIRLPDTKASTASAAQEARVLLMVGAPATDAVLLKRYVRVCPSSFGGSSGERIEAGCFTFHIPPSLRAGGLSSPPVKIEARCLVLHMVGLDVVARVSSLSAQNSSETSTRSGAVPASAATLDRYVTPRRSQSAALAKCGVGVGDGGCDGGDRTATVEQAAASAAIAAEARDSFDALLADMTYIASEERAPSRKRPQPSASAASVDRKRHKKQAEEAAQVVSKSDTEAAFYDADGEAEALSSQETTQTGGRGVSGFVAFSPQTAPARFTEEEPSSAARDSRPLVEDETAAASVRAPLSPPATLRAAEDDAKRLFFAETARSTAAHQQRAAEAAEGTSSAMPQTSAAVGEAAATERTSSRGAVGSHPILLRPSSGTGRSSPVAVRLRRSASPPATCPVVAMDRCAPHSEAPAAFRPFPDTVPSAPYRTVAQGEPWDGVPPAEVHGHVFPLSAHQQQQHGAQRTRWSFSASAPEQNRMPAHTSAYRGADSVEYPVSYGGPPPGGYGGMAGYGYSTHEGYYGGGGAVAHQRTGYPYPLPPVVAGQLYHGPGTLMEAAGTPRRRSTVPYTQWRGPEAHDWHAVPHQGQASPYAESGSFRAQPRTDYGQPYRGGVPVPFDFRPYAPAAPQSQPPRSAAPPPSPYPQHTLIPPRVSATQPQHQPPNFGFFSQSGRQVDSARSGPPAMQLLSQQDAAVPSDFGGGGVTPARPPHSLQRATPSASATFPPGSAAYTPHVRRTAMVSRSWWQ